MGTFVIERIVAVPPRQMWGIVTDWAGYARWMPLTTMRLDQGPTRVGWSFAGLTGVGRLRFSDVMRVTEWAPPAEAGPGAFRLVKVGHLLAGWAEVSVLPIAGGEQTRLLWRENIVIRPVSSRQAACASHGPIQPGVVRQGGRRHGRGSCARLRTEGLRTECPRAIATAAGIVVDDSGVARCWWAASTDDYMAYHDDEWGVAVHGEAGLYERLTLEAFQSGLSWLTILRKREGFRAAFAGFDADAVAAFGEADLRTADGRHRHRAQPAEDQGRGHQRPGRGSAA